MSQALQCRACFLHREAAPKGHGSGAKTQIAAPVEAGLNPVRPQRGDAPFNQVIEAGGQRKI